MKQNDFRTIITSRGLKNEMKRLVVFMLLLGVPVAALCQSGNDGDEQFMPLPDPLPTGTERLPAADGAVHREKTPDPEYTVEELRNKVAGYTRMNTAGSKLLIAGGIVTPLAVVGLISGVAMLVEGNEAGFPFYLFGASGVTLGPPMLAAGAVLKNIGSKKQTEYERRLHLQLSLNAVRLNCLF